MDANAAGLKTFLCATPFFGGLADQSLDRLVSMLVERRYDAGESVFREGDPGRSMYIVQSGELVVSKNAESGRSIRMTRLGPGDFFGETTLIEMQNRPSTIVVQAPGATLYELTNASLYQLYKQDVNAYVMVMQNVNRELCRRLRKAEERVAEVADQSRDELTQIKRRPSRPARKA